MADVKPFDAVLLIIALTDVIIKVTYLRTKYGKESVKIYQ